MQDTVSPRSFQLDLIRVLGMFLVVGVHTSTSSYPTTFTPFFNLTLLTATGWYFLTKLGVPLLILLSGYLLLRNGELPKQFLQKRLVRICRPWILWTTIAVFVVTFSKNTPLTLNIAGQWWTTAQSYWYVFVAVGLSLLTPLLRTVMQARKYSSVWLLAGGWFVGCSLFPVLLNSAAFPLATDPGLVRLVISFSGYFLLGSVLPTIPLSKQHWLGLFFVSLVSALLFSHWQQGGDHPQRWLEYTSPLVVLASCSLFLLLLRMPTIAKLKQPLAALSSVSYGVFFLHSILLNSVLGVQQWTKNILFTAILSWSIVLLLNRIPKIGQWFR